jgi:hypothetical protein
MKWFTKLGTGVLVLAFGLMLGWSTTADARSLGFIVGAATVDDVTTTVCVEDNGTLRGFGNGVSMDQVWALEREVGSKGSGAWQAVSGYKDVFPTAQGGAAVGGAVQITDYVSKGPGCYRLRMTTDGGGTGQIQLVGAGNTPTVWASTDANSRTNYRHFDDFQHGALPITTTHNGDTPSYIVHIGAGANAVLSVIEGEGEGAMTFSSGDAGDDTDLSTGSFGLLTTGALVSDGLIACEFRISSSQITDTRWGIGLVDLISAATEIEPFEANTNVVAEGAVTSVANAIAIGFDTDAINSTYQAYSNNANTLGNASDEYSLVAAPVAATYSVLRVEVDSLGDGYFYVDGVLRGVETKAVATTAVLIPYWWAGTADDATGTVVKMYIDYIDFWAARPTGAS